MASGNKNIDHARHDPALGLISIFRPICRGRRPAGLQYKHEHEGCEIRINVWRALDTRDQSVLLAAIGMAGIENLPLGSDAPGEVGKQLWTDLKPEETAEADKAVVVTTTRYALLQAAGIHDRGASYGLLEDCLERLSMVGYRAKQNGNDWSMHLLSYAKREDGRIHIALNSRIARSIAGHNVRISLQERRDLGNEAAKIAHAWICAWLKGGKTNLIRLDKLAEKVWGNDPVRSSTVSSRRERISEALAEVDTLNGWNVALQGRGQNAKATIKRPATRILDRGQ